MPVEVRVSNFELFTYISAGSGGSATNPAQLLA